MVNKERSKEGRKATDEDKTYSEPFIWFVRILFVVIVGNGFRTFSANFSFEKFINTPTLVLLTFFAYFVAGYFFVISDFVFYQFQIQRYPYLNRKTMRFFEDIVIFFLLYLLLDLASAWPTPRKLWGFLLLLSLWHFFVMLWQVHMNYQYERKRTRGMVHLWKSLMYLVVLGLYTYRQSGITARMPNGTTPEDSVPAIMVWIWLVVALIAISNGVRLYRISKLT
jgi:hypothetical protein